jgi:dihydrofolate reductase
MRKLIVFDAISLDGYFADENSDMSWAHQQDDEWRAWTEENAGGGGELVFGRVTYDLMAGYWLSELAHKNDPAVAEAMNRQPKVVFSRTLVEAPWHNTRLIKGELATEMRTLKAEAGPPLVILGSGSLVAQLTDARLIDEYLLVVNAIVLGRGRGLFAGVRERARLRLQGARTFTNGNVVLTYAPAQRGT